MTKFCGTEVTFFSGPSSAFQQSFTNQRDGIHSQRGFCRWICKKVLYIYRNSYGAYSSELTMEQALLVRVNLEGTLSRLRKYRPEDIVEAIAYVLKTGCQWPMLPLHFPKWKTVYHHFRSLSDRGWFRFFLRLLIEGRRASLGLSPETSVCVVDSQSVRSDLPQSEKAPFH